MTPDPTRLTVRAVEISDQLEAEFPDRDDRIAILNAALHWEMCALSPEERAMHEKARKAAELAAEIGMRRLGDIP